MVSHPSILDLVATQFPDARIFEWGTTIHGKKSRLHNVNLIFERRLPGTVDRYDDLAHVVGIDENDQWYDHVVPCTTDPGLPSLIKGRTTRPSGTWITQPGQYRGSHQIGLHHHKPALVQRKPLRGWRDRDDDGIVDRSGPTYTDGRGINHHRGGTTRRVGPHSEGCLVTPVSLDGIEYWAPHWGLILQAAQLWGDVFTTTIVEVSAP